MTSAEIRQSFLDFFQSKQHTIVPSSSLHAGLAEPAVHQRRHEPVRAHLPRPDKVPLRRPAAPPTPRNASAPAANTTTSMTSASTPITTRSSRCSATGRFGDYFKKEAIEWAWELVVERLEVSRRNALYATVYQPDKPQGDPERVRPGSVGHLGREVPQRRARSRRPHRQRQQEGQLLDDGRHRPVRPVLRTARRPHARRRHQGRARQQGRRRAASRSGTSSSSSSTRTPTARSRRCPRKHVDTGMGFERVTLASSRARRASPISRTPRSPTTRPTSSARSSTRSRS